MSDDNHPLMPPTVRVALMHGLWCPLLLVLILAGGCATDEAAPADANGAGITYTDDAGRTVHLNAPARRIVTLAPNLTEIVFAAGAGDRLAGVGTADDHPPAVDTLTRLSVLPVDFEALTRLQPDLILATTQVNSPRDARTFEALDIPVVYLAFDSVGAIFDAVHDVGRLAGTSAAAETAADSLARAYRQIERRTAERGHHPRVLFLIGDETLYAFGRHSYIQDMITAAGGRSLTAHIDRRAPVLSDEFVLEQQPDIIVGTWGDDYDPERILELHPTWRSLPAAERERIYTVDPDLVLRPGPRVVEGTRRLAALLHPDTADETTTGP